MCKNGSYRCHEYSAGDFTLEVTWLCLIGKQWDKLWDVDLELHTEKMSDKNYALTSWGNRLTIGQLDFLFLVFWRLNLDEKSFAFP